MRNSGGLWEIKGEESVAERKRAEKLIKREAGLEGRGSKKWTGEKGFAQGSGRDA